MTETELLGLYRSDVEYPYENKVATCAYYMVAEQGNVVFYSYSKIESDFVFIQKLGGVHRICLSHRDEFARSCKLLAKRFDSKITIHRDELAAITRTHELFEPFSERSVLDENLIAIPTPGHTPGSSCYLAFHRDKRLLFTGDTLFESNGRWSVAITPENRNIMIQSLKVIKLIDADYWCPGLAVGQLRILNISKAMQGSAIDDCISRLREGGIH